MDLPSRRHRVPHSAVAGRAEVQGAGDDFMSAFSVSRFYAADDVDSAFSQNIESLFNRFRALQACKTGWHVDLLGQYWQYVARNWAAVDGNRQTSGSGNGCGERLQRWRQLVTASLRSS